MEEISLKRNWYENVEGKKILEIGTGQRLRPGINPTERHDFFKHHPAIDTTSDINSLPWEWEDESWDLIFCIDQLQRLDMEVIDWMREIHRILKPSGIAVLRLPAWDNPLSYRNITNKRVFHEESLDYFDPSKELYKTVSISYWQKETIPLFSITLVDRRNNDFVYELRKI